MAAVKAELHFRSGEKRVFSEPAGEGDADPNLSTTHKSILKIQKDVNDALTELVNAEKAAGPQGDGTDAATQPQVGKDSSDSTDEEDEDDEEEEKNGTSNNSTHNIDNEPASKKQKT